MAMKQTETTNKVVKTQKPDNVYILELKNITKTFLGGKIVANDNISLSFKRNEIHALVGENGSGKSTLMNILFGLYKQDKGNVFFNGTEMDMYKSGTAKKCKIGMVHQHFHLVENFTVLENILLGQENIEMDALSQTKITNRKAEIQKAISSYDDKKVLIYKDIVKEDFINRKFLHELKFKIKKIERISKGEKHNVNSVSERIQYILKYKNPIKVSHEINLLKEQLIEAENKMLLFAKETKILKSEDKKIFTLVFELSELKQEENSFNTVGSWGNIRYQQAINRFSKISNEYGINLSADVKVSTLPVGQRQMVEIMKILWDRKDLIVFDEPTATLSILEIDKLMSTIKLLKKEGKTIIFISHKLNEVKKISDRVSVLRKGKLISTHKNDSKLNPKKISTEMVGREINFSYPERKIKIKPILDIKNISYITSKGFKSVNNISFTVNEGEIFGLAGIEGNGQEETLKMISGLRLPSYGEIKFKDEVIYWDNVYSMNQNLRRRFISHIPIDRYKHGMVSNKDLEFNAILSDFDTGLLPIDENIKTEYKDIFRNIFNDYEKEKNILKKSSIEISENKNIFEEKGKAISSFSSEKQKLEKKYRKKIKLQENKLLKKIRTSSASKQDIENFTYSIIKEFNVEGAFNNSVEIRNLSGGNQQKFIVGREVNRNHSLLLAGHPTRGLDIAAIDMIYKKIIKNSKGKATILYSLEISELIAVCDRMAIMYKGEIVGIVDPKKVSMEKISNMMIGIE